MAVRHVLIYMKALSVLGKAVQAASAGDDE